MKHFTLIRKALLSSILLANFLTANSQGTPFVCDGKFFISHGNANASNSQTLVEQVTFPSPGVVNVVNFPLNSSTTGFNGIGMNPADGYLYGFSYPTAGAHVNLVRVGNSSPTNTIQNLGAVTTPGAGSDLDNGEYVYAASFRKDGLLYFLTNTNELYSMPTSELATGAGNREATHIANLNGTGNNAPPSLGMADLGVDPTNGDIYAVSTNTGTNPTALFRVNATTGALTRIGIYVAPAGDFIAGLFFTENGTLYGYRSDGTFQLFDKTTAAFTLVGNPPVYDFADGCSCVFRISHDLNAPLELCPTNQNTQPAFNFTVTITNNYQAVSGVIYDLTLDYRYSFTQTAAQIAASFATAGYTNGGATITSTGGGTNNKLQITGISIPFPITTPNVLIAAKLATVVTPLVPANFQSTFSGLPVSLGSLDISNDPKTSPPDDPTRITMCSNITLPVKLLYFRGELKNNVAKLNWESSLEDNVQGYVLERSSNGTSFVDVATIAAKGAGQVYNYNDIFVSGTEKVFYRLRVIEQSGQKYSGIVLLRSTSSSGDISVSPNPFVKDLQFSITSAKSSGINYSLHDMSGKIVRKGAQKISAGTNNFYINDASALQAGMYMLRVIFEDNTTKTIRIIKNQN